MKKRIVSDSRRIYSLFRKLDVIKSRTFLCGDRKLHSMFDNDSNSLKSKFWLSQDGFLLFGVMDSIGTNFNLFEDNNNKGCWMMTQTPCIPGEISENGLLKEVIMTLNMRTGFLVKCHLSSSLSKRLIRNCYG